MLPSSEKRDCAGSAEEEDESIHCPTKDCSPRFGRKMSCTKSTFMPIDKPLAGVSAGGLPDACSGMRNVPSYKQPTNSGEVVHGDEQCCWYHTRRRGRPAECALSGCSSTLVQRRCESARRARPQNAPLWRRQPFMSCQETGSRESQVGDRLHGSELPLEPTSGE